MQGHVPRLSQVILGRREQGDQTRTEEKHKGVWYLLHLILGMRVGVAEIRNVRYGTDLPLLHDL